MVNFVSVVVAMVLMTIVVVAGLNYLGPEFMDNSSKVQLAQYLNKGVQIHGALQLYKAENQGAVPTGTGQQQVAALAQAGYLKEVPDAMWEIDSQLVYRDVGTQATCYKLNNAAGMDMSSPGISSFGGCPPCDDVDYSGYPACTRADTPVVTGN